MSAAAAPAAPAQDSKVITGNKCHFMDLGTKILPGPVPKGNLKEFTYTDYFFFWTESNPRVRALWVFKRLRKPGVVSDKDLMFFGYPYDKPTSQIMLQIDPIKHMLPFINGRFTDRCQFLRIIQETREVFLTEGEPGDKSHVALPPPDEWKPLGTLDDQGKLVE